MKFDIPRTSIILTDNVQNTDQEAKSIKKLLPNRKLKIILVTSAFHMPRAQNVFEAVDIQVIPFPVDFQHQSDKITFMDFIPSAGSFKETSFFVKEIIGRLYYNLKY